MSEAILPSYLPAAAVTFTPADGGAEKTVYRPYAAFSPDDLRAHAAQEERGALQELGERYYFGIGGVEQDYAQAYPLLLKASELGVQDAMYLIAECYRQGLYVAQDAAKAVQWLHMAAQAGSWMAMISLSAVYRDGIGGTVIDHAQSFYWTQQAERMTRIYWEFYTQPDFVDFTDTQAMILRGNTRAALQLSAHYADGVGVQRDLDEAERWLRRGNEFIARATGLMKVPAFTEALDKLQKRREKERARAQAAKRKKKKS